MWNKFTICGIKNLTGWRSLLPHCHLLNKYLFSHSPLITEPQLCLGQQGIWINRSFPFFLWLVVTKDTLAEACEI